MNYIISFLLGAIGALFIVWLRWTDALPRFKSSIEISLLEDEYKNITKHITSTIDDSKTLDSADVTYSNSLRDDIWRQRKSSFLFSAIMYIFLGGATALIFIGLDIQSFDSGTILKLISAGALWSSFYSFIEVKNADSFNEEEREKVDLEQKKILEDLKTQYNNSIIDLENQMDSCVSTANNRLRTIIKDYNDLVEENEKLRSQIPVGGNI